MSATFLGDWAKGLLLSPRNVTGMATGRESMCNYFPEKSYSGRSTGTNGVTKTRS